MTAIRYWFLGFRAGWWTPTPIPYGALTARDIAMAAFARGYVFAQYIRWGVR